MGESLTPILTREQYRRGYLSYLAKENSMNLMNLAANQTFASEGETIGTLYSQSSTVSAIPREQKLAILAMKMQGYLKQPDLTIRQLPNNQLDFLYVGIDTIKQLMGASGVQLPMEDLMFRQYMSQLLVGAKDTASFKAAYGTPTPEVDGANAPDPNALNAMKLDENESAVNARGNSMSSHFVDDDSMSTVTGPTQVDTTDDFPDTDDDDDDDSGYSGGESRFSRPMEAARLRDARQQGSAAIRDRAEARASQIEQMVRDARQQGSAAIRDRAEARIGQIEQMVRDARTDALNEIARRGMQRADAIDPASAGFGLKSALKKQQRTGKRGPRGRLILGEGLTPLGKHFLDTYDLENHNKVCIRYQGGKLVKAIPAKVVGGTVAGALKSIVKGKAPSAMDVEKMTEEERNYLNLISSKAHVKQLQVPSKDKTAEEKLVHKFNTMKGEIIAGNDNKDLIKEFKLLLLKLKQMSKISKDDVNEILMDLAALGY